MFFSTKCTKTLHWMPLNGVGTNCDQKYIRLRADHTTVLIEANTPDDPGAALRTRFLGQGNKKKFAKGDVGFCYAAHAAGVMYIGFGSDTKTPPRSGLSAVSGARSAIGLSLPSDFDDYAAFR